MDTPILSKNVDLISSNYLNTNMVYWGFEGAEYGSRDSRIRNIVMAKGPMQTVCVPDAIVDSSCPDVSTLSTGCTSNLVDAINAFVLQKRGQLGSSYSGKHINCALPLPAPPSLQTVYLNDADGKYRFYYETKASCVAACTSGTETMVLQENASNYTLNLASNDNICGITFGNCSSPNLNPVTISIKKVEDGSEINPSNLISISKPYNTNLAGSCPNRNIAYVDVTYKSGTNIVVSKCTLEQYHGPAGNAATTANEARFSPFPDCNKFAIVQGNLTKPEPCPGRTATANFVLQSLGTQLISPQYYVPESYSFNIQYNGANILSAPVGRTGGESLLSTFQNLANQVGLKFDLNITVTQLTAGNGGTIKPTFRFFIEGKPNTGSRFNGKEVRIVTTSYDGKLLVMGSAVLSDGQDPGDCCGNNKMTYTLDWDAEKQKCLAFQRDVATATATRKWTEARNSFISNYLSNNYNTCFSTDFKESFSYTYTNFEYHYTLYYYDQAGNLVQTVPPSGVNPLGDDAFPGGVYNGTPPAHTMATTYQYNSLNQLVKTSSPDGGTTKYWYDQYGRLRLSQNTKQAAAAANTYSYTLYDNSNRITEVGEAVLAITPSLLDVPATLYPFLANASNFTGNNRSHITVTIYDTPVGQQENLRNRVSSTQILQTAGSFVHASSMYSYDPHGNVRKIVQNVTGLGSKTLDYTYELVSGLVKQVDYQKGAEDQFSHRYFYDADGRLRTVNTSPNGYLWEEDAQYFYYKHGPLARTELGHDKVQGLDYFYTAQGWLKGVNLPSARAPLATPNTLNQYRTSLDPGNDAAIGYIHGWIAQDEYSLSLGYHANDYTPIGGEYEPISHLGVNLGLSANSMVWDGNFLGSSNVYPMYNGNIAFTIQQMPGVSSGNLDGSNPVNATGYRYDQLNRLVQGRSFVTSTDGSGVTSWVTRPGISIESNKFDFGYSYDPNGNIKTATVNDQFGNARLNLAYNYANTANNQLTSVTAATGSSSTHPLMVKPSGYSYDEIGNLKGDQSEDIDLITWSPYGKILSVTRKPTSTAPDLVFTYNPQGQRSSKKVIPKGLNPVSVTTSYIYDASGHAIAQYEYSTSASATAASNIEVEYPIYGSSRIGLYKKILKGDYAPTKSNAKAADNNLFAASNFIVNIPVGPHGGPPYYQLNLTKVLPTAYDQGVG
ncbi:MAG: hypothetical protein K2Q22_02545, partial [Cytophagales bacterium]|nr:hypothetical protein [Cytophagales bacterium]